MEQQQVSLGFLFPYIKNGGIYVLEDLHTSLPGSRPRFGLKKDLTNSTLKMLENFISDGKIISEYMSEEEILYLNSNIEYCEIFKNPNRNSITCIIGKNKWIMVFLLDVICQIKIMLERMMSKGAFLA